MSIGKALYNLRKSRGLTQKELSDALGGKIAQTTAGQYELGIRTPSRKNLKLLADFYNVPVSYLMSDEEPGDAELSYTIIDLMHQDQEYRTLFDVVKTLSPDDLRPVNAILKNIAKGRMPDE